MKKLLGIVVLGLLLSSNAYAKEIKVYHKDENSISMTKKLFGRSKTDAVAAKHCAQHGKFAFRFEGFYNHGAPDEEGESTYLYHCSKKELSKSPISGKKRRWTNYDENHKFSQQQKEDEKFAKIEQYKATCTTLGFELGTDKFADCTLKLFVADNKEKTQVVQTSSGTQEIIIRDPDRERRIQRKRWNDLMHGRCELNAFAKNPC